MSTERYEDSFGEYYVEDAIPPSPPEPDINEHDDKIKVLLDSLKIPYTYKHRAKDVYILERSWDGETINMDFGHFYTLHEMGHYMVCSKDRRAFSDFGLGGLSDDLSGEHEPVVPYPERNYEDYQASMLGGLYQLALGIVPDLINILTGSKSNLIIRHKDTSDNFWAVLAALDTKGLLKCPILLKSGALVKLLTMIEDRAPVAQMA